MKKEIAKPVTPMNLDAIKDVVSKARPGAWKTLSYIYGRYEHHIVVCTKNNGIRFKVNYNNTKIAKFTKAVREASSKEDMVKIAKIYAKFRPSEIDCLAKNIKKLLADKAADIKAKEAIYDSKPRKTTAIRDTKYPFIIYAQNDNILLEGFETFAYNFKSGAEEKPTFEVYHVDGDVTYKLIPENETDREELGKIITASKSSAARSVIYRFNIKNIVSIK